jgi:tripartite-type tricarboxylate transporter receptor subunit TctC
MMGATDFMAKYLYNLSYDPERDLVPVSMIETLPAALIVRASLPAKSVAELISYAKDHPGELTYGSTGPGGWFHVNALLFSSITHINLRHIPYGQGSPVIDLLGDHIDTLLKNSAPGTDVTDVLVFEREG